MFIGDLVYFTNLILDKNHNLNSSPTICLQLLYLLDADYYKATGNFLVDDNNFAIWNGFNTLRISKKVRDCYGDREKLIFNYLDLLSLKDNFYFDPQYDKRPNIDFNTYKDASGNKIDVKLFKSLYSPDYLKEKLNSLIDGDGNWCLPDTRKYGAIAKTLLKSTGNWGIYPISNHDRMLEIEGKLGDKYQECLNKIERDRQMILDEKNKEKEKVDNILSSISNGDSNYVKDCITDDKTTPFGFFKKLFSKKKPKDQDLSMEF